MDYATLVAGTVDELVEQIGEFQVFFSAIFELISIFFDASKFFGGEIRGSFGSGFSCGCFGSFGCRSCSSCFSCRSYFGSSGHFGCFGFGCFGGHRWVIGWR